MRKFFTKLYLFRFLLISFSLLIVLNIFFGKKNLFLLNENFLKIENIKNEFSTLSDEYENVKFIHKEFKKNNLDLQETLIREVLNYKQEGEKIIIYE